MELKKVKTNRKLVIVYHFSKVASINITQKTIRTFRWDRKPMDVLVYSGRTVIVPYFTRCKKSSYLISGELKGWNFGYQCSSSTLLVVLWFKSF